jgi:TRAP-type C4-dicarboxylate transport system permease small subunit
VTESNIIRSLADKIPIPGYFLRDFEGYLSLLLMLAYTVIILRDVITRTVSGSTEPWSLEISLGLFAWLAWLSCSFAVKHQSHFRFTLLRSGTSPTLNYLLYWIEWILWIVIMGLVLRYSVPVLQSYLLSQRTVVGTDLPTALLYLSVPVGMVLIIFRVLQQMYVVTGRYRRGEDTAVTSDIGIEGELR